MKTRKDLLEFDWDKGNIGKNLRHKVKDQECEEVFFDKDKVVVEERFILLGKTKKNRLLYLVFTIRKKKIRIISARDINKKEVYLYEKTIKSS